MPILKSPFAQVSYMIIILVDVNDFFVLRRNRIAEERRRPLCPALVVMQELTLGRTEY